MESIKIEYNLNVNELYISPNTYVYGTCGVLHPIAKTAGFKHLVKSKYNRFFLFSITPVPQTFPDVSDGYKT